MRVAVVTPVLDDWASLSKLVGMLDVAEVREDVRFSVFIVDDGSSEPMVVDTPLTRLRRIRDLEVVGLACNLGHQRAIAVGLVEVSARRAFDAVLVMDCDGEDRPADVPRLLAEAARRPGHIIVARRQRRPHLLGFRLWYQCYKTLFRLLTGARIDFGNFCLIPGARLEALVSTSAIWNNLAAALTRSRIPLADVPCDRGTRYAGNSKMNFLSLVMHGFSAMAVYTDVIMLRLMLGALVLSGITALGILGVVATRLLTSLAIPGWASSAAGALTIILLQGVMLFTISAFSVLNTRNLKSVIPRVDAPDFVRFRRSILRSAAIGAGRAQPIEVPVIDVQPAQ
jgi:polyisoprenyl-phosphate glycosyltransferase